MDRLIQTNTAPVLIQRVVPHGERYDHTLNKMLLDIINSNLLGRLFYAKEPIRTRMCPVHKGHYSGQAMFFQKCPQLCDGTGWLRENLDDRGFAGVKISIIGE